MDLGMSQLIILLLLVIIVPGLLLVAFLPSIIAVKINHPHQVAIILVNILGGLFFGIGWLVALVWCFIVPNRNTSVPINVASEIEKLHELREKGILTQEEYDSTKRTLLNR